MMSINWNERVQERKETVITDTQALLRQKSVLDPSTARQGEPFGKDIADTYNWLLNKARNEGFSTKDIEGYAGHIEYGEGEDIIGILCHIDVVPEGDGWSSDPYGAEIKDGKIIARGAIDDKGPTMAAYHALKLVKDLELPLSKRVRIIIGTDEESEWRCVDRYFKEEKMPLMGFAPDADFPVIYSEKGICDLFYTRNLKGDEKEGEHTLVHFKSGHRLNMVPENAVAVIETQYEDDLVKQFESFLHEEKLTGETKVLSENQIELTVKGRSVHGMEPDKGINGGLEMARFLQTCSFQASATDFAARLGEKFARDSRGKKLGIAHHDEQLGDLTMNIGILEYKDGKEAMIGINLRYPKGASFDEVKAVLDREMAPFEGVIKTHETPHMVEESSELVKVLSKVYEEQTGKKTELIAIGGGTYARSLDEGVAFGPLFPHRDDLAHQADEAIYIEDLLKATSIYAQAIYELAK
ncbi:dipeptidase PepV [Alteribacter keqinensis]|uniref:Dipeptidase PepV n=1 Tax=Alteribacter keqinensis TaxID=2483800 RepID=A0A3M7TXT4_9BACI|nr:dipeptidase PepV [Alteribacter keqinensis]RNA70407.1 dipeptidase PepV [Alteribacter keqinensis]